MIVEAKMTVRMNTKKITAIKGVREITGMGLTEAKTYVENYDGQTQTVRMTLEQLGKATLVQREWNDSQRGFGYEGPVLEIYAIKRVDAPDFRDFTKN